MWWSCACSKGGASFLLFFLPSSFHCPFFQVEDDTLVYANTLFHTPTLNRFGIIRSAGMAIPLECRYKRLVWGQFQHCCYTCAHHLVKNLVINLLVCSLTGVCVYMNRTHFVSSNSQSKPVSLALLSSAPTAPVSSPHFMTGVFHFLFQ